MNRRPRQVAIEAEPASETTCPRCQLFGKVTEFDAIQWPKPYRKIYREHVKKSLEKVDVEWNTPILAWGTILTSLQNSWLS
jgi:hypothetical protein